MPLKTPHRLNEDMVRYWISEGQRAHGPVLEWMSNPQVAKALERFANAALDAASKNEILNQIQRRSDVAEVKVNLKKISADFFRQVPPQAHRLLLPSGGTFELSASKVQIALEALFLDAGYQVSDGVAVTTIILPDEDEEPEEDAFDLDAIDSALDEAAEEAGASKEVVIDSDVQEDPPEEVDEDAEEE